VTEAAAAGRAEGLDMGAALVLVQAARLGLGRLKDELVEAAHALGSGQRRSPRCSNCRMARPRRTGIAGSRHGMRCPTLPRNRRARKPVDHGVDSPWA
jgi:hypothetical protein